LIDRDAFRRLADVVLEAATADHVFVSLDDCNVGTTRFVESRIIEDTRTGQRTLSIAVAFEQQCGIANTTDLSDEAVLAALEQAEELASLSEPDPRFVPPLPRQRFPVLPTLRLETAAAGAERRAAEARQAIELCRGTGVRASGSVSTEIRAVGLAANTGLFAYEQRSVAAFELTATGADSAAVARDANRSIDDLSVVEHARSAIEKAGHSVAPRQIAPGAYTVVLEPAAVASLLQPMLSALDAAAYHSDTSPLAGRLGEQIVDARLTLRNRPDHPDLLGNGFDAQGLPGDSQTWIDSGVLTRLHYDRFTAEEHGVAPSYQPDAVHLSGGDAAIQSMDELIRSIERGILIGELGALAVVDPVELTLAGTCRGGAFLIANGEIVGGLPKLRWRESPLRLFNRIEAYTAPCGAYGDFGKMLVPAMRCRDFDFKSALST
jgi:predicted Zn-dependent protease